MNVQELIERLRAFPMEMRVECVDCAPHKAHLPQVCQKDLCDCSEGVDGEESTT